MSCNCKPEFQLTEVVFSCYWLYQKWYPVSKTLAEKSAWEFAKKNGLDVVAINPSTCLGQLLQPGLNASCAALQQLLQGSKDTQEYHWLGAVHVRDVAKVQVLLFETSAASGRYLCTNGIYQFADFAKKVSELFPEFPIHRYVISQLCCSIFVCNNEIWWYDGLLTVRS